ncbi:hypothetical protein N657DRAFT_637840 [Parathielavia appendiculata]|uniref:Uncharacterized protein n=1 Tax=Parathielavia appendiculata TaxID=2587402 RepID=A0AAN6TQD5_9PEZI|nr:hypothetical protein N657DRAFT_637840 [Parathielavia appendiculata]
MRLLVGRRSHRSALDLHARDKPVGWFNDYTQYCPKTEDCQDRAFEAQQSRDVWLYEFVPSALAWLKVSTGVVGERESPGYRGAVKGHVGAHPGLVLPEPSKGRLDRDQIK